MKNICNFGHISAQNPEILRKLLSLAILRADDQSNNNKEDLFTIFTEHIEHFPLNDDDRKLLWLEFLELLKTPQEDIERIYLETIFKLENENRLAVHLADFIENAHI